MAQGKSSKRKGHPDKIYFKDMNNFKPEHKQLMMKHLKDVIVKVNNDEMTIEGLISNLKGTLISLTNLKKSYEQ